MLMVTPSLIPLLEAQAQTTQRLFSDPGLPRPNPTQAHWQLPPHALSTVQSASLTSETDILILGSGITGCSVAKSLLSLSSDSTITLLEARTITSGATGRNGGHIATHPVIDYGDLVDVVGKEEAVKILRFRLGHYGMIYEELEALGKEALDVSELRRVESVVGLLDEETLRKVKALHTRMEEDVPELKGRVGIYTKGDPGFEVSHSFPSFHFLRRWSEEAYQLTTLPDFPNVWCSRHRCRALRRNLALPNDNNHFLPTSRQVPHSLSNRDPNARSIHHILFIFISSIRSHHSPRQHQSQADSTLHERLRWPSPPFTQRQDLPLQRPHVCPSPGPVLPEKRRPELECGV